MKRFFLLIALLTVSSAAHSAPGYLWRINPPAHSKWSGTCTQQVLVTEIISDPSGAYFNKLDIATRQDAQFDWDVLSKDKAGLLKIQLRYNGISSNAYLKMNDAPAPPLLQQSLVNRLETLNQILRGATLTFTLSPTGKVSELQGAEGLAEAFKRENNRRDAGIGSTMGSEYKAFYTAAGLESIMSSGAKLPPRALQVGQSYTYRYTEGDEPGYALVAGVKRTLANRQSNLSTFVESGPFKVEQTRQPSGVFVTFNGTGTMTGTTHVTEWNGVVARSTGQVRLRGTYITRTPSKIQLTVPAAIAMDAVVTMQPRNDDPGVIISPE